MDVNIKFDDINVEGASELQTIKFYPATPITNGSITESQLSDQVRAKLNNGGMSTSAKLALLALLEKVAYIDTNGQTYLNNLEAFLFNAFSVTNTLENVENSNSNVYANEGVSYTATLTPTEGLIRSVTITMGGVDVTSQVFTGVEE